MTAQFRSLVVLLLVMAGCAGPEVREEARSAGGSFVLVTIDTLRADRLEPYGAEALSTPNLLRLAEDAVLFEQVVAASPVTLPSHATLFTGLDPPRHGVRNNGSHYLRPDLVTLAELLRGEGYRTAAFVSAAVLERRFGLDQGFEHYDDDLSAGGARELRLNSERPAEATIDAALAWLASVPAGEPYFLWLHLFDPHAPYQAPEPFPSRYPGRPYDAEVAYVDSQLGRLLADPRVSDDDLLMVIGDHGESLGEHGEQTHAMLLYEAVLHIPWLVRSPLLPVGTRFRSPVGQVDLLPTTLELLDIEPPEALPGMSLVGPLVGGDEEELDRALYSESLVPFYSYGWAQLRSLRSGRWKLIDAPRPELYDLEADPAESVDLYSRERRRASELEARLRNFSGPEVDESARSSLDPATAEKLRSLGYLAASGASSGKRERLDPKDVIDVHLAVERASHLFVRHQLEPAIEELRGVLRRDPDNLAASTTLARALAGTGAFEEAFAVASRALQGEPSSPEVHLTMGILEAARGRCNEALPHFEGALELEPSSVDARLEMALCEDRLGRIESARARILELLAEVPDYGRLEVAVAELVERPAGDLAAAEERLFGVTRQEPALARGWLVLAEVQMQRGDPEEALATCRRGLEHQPRHGGLQARAGLLLLSSGRPAEAEPHLRRAAELLAPASPAVHAGLSQIALRAGRLDEAEAEVRLALALDPSLGGAWNQLALVLEEKDEPQAALDAYDRAKQHAPDYWRADYNRAILLRRLGRFGEAATGLDGVLLLQPEHPGAHYEIGLLLIGPLSDPERGRYHLRRSLELEPGHPRAAQLRELLLR